MNPDHLIIGLTTGRLDWLATRMDYFSKLTDCDWRVRHQFLALTIEGVLGTVEPAVVGLVVEQWKLYEIDWTTQLFPMINGYLISNRLTNQRADRVNEIMEIYRLTISPAQLGSLIKKLDVLIDLATHGPAVSDAIIATQDCLPAFRAKYPVPDCWLLGRFGHCQKIGLYLASCCTIRSLADYDQVMDGYTDDEIDLGHVVRRAVVKPREFGQIIKRMNQPGYYGQVNDLKFIHARGSFTWPGSILEELITCLIVNRESWVSLVEDLAVELICSLNLNKPRLATKPSTLTHLALAGIKFSAVSAWPLNELFDRPVQWIRSIKSMKSNSDSEFDVAFQTGNYYVIVADDSGLWLAEPNRQYSLTHGWLGLTTLTIDDEIESLKILIGDESL